MANASIDLAKILLASEKRAIPQTYREIVRNLAILPSFDGTIAEKLSVFSQTRNILAHEYLDLRFMRIKRFLAEGRLLYEYLVKYSKGILAKGADAGK